MVIVDTDFFSSLAKIKGLDFIVKMFGFITIPSTVYNELKQTDFFEGFLGLFVFSESGLTKDKFVLIRCVDEDLVRSVKEQTENRLGDGEVGCFILAKEHKEKVLTDDRFARDYARTQNIRTVSLPSFLFLCKRKGIIPKEEMQKIVDSLKENDYYEFKKEIKEELLK